jgi:hypothetical protein
MPTHCSAVCEGTGHESSRETGIQLQQLSNDDRSSQAGHTDNDGQQYWLQTIPLYRLHKLWADRVADPEQEQQEEEGFGHARDGNMRELPDEQAREKRACHRAETEGANLEASDPVARSNDQKQRELRIPNQKLFQPG